MDRCSILHTFSNGTETTLHQRFLSRQLQLFSWENRARQIITSAHIKRRQKKKLEIFGLFLVFHVKIHIRGMDLVGGKTKQKTIFFLNVLFQQVKI